MIVNKYLCDRNRVIRTLSIAVDLVDSATATRAKAKADLSGELN